MTNEGLAREGVIPAAQQPSHSSFVVQPRGFVRRKFRQWWQSRLPLNDTLTLTQRNVYILPTRPGFMLGATLLVLLVASIALFIGGFVLNIF